MDARVREHVVRAAIYCRISDDRAGDGLGVKRQERECHELVERRGWEVADVYTDNDVSAYSGAPRPEYERLVADIEAGVVGAVVAYHNDRLHRSTKELDRFIDLVERTGVEVQVTSGGVYDLTTSDGRLNARIVGAVARAESERKSERIRSEQAQRAERGLPSGGTRGFGYEYQDGNLVVVEAEAALIRKAAEAVVSGRAGWTTVARDWNAAGVPSPRGNEWTAKSVTAALTKPALAGLRVHNGEVVGDAAWPAIIDRATHERLNARAEAEKGSRRGRPPVHLLTNIAWCADCDNGMTTASQAKGRRVYKCRKAPGESDGCSRTIMGDGLDRFVTEAVLDRLSGPSLVEFLSNLDDGERDYAALVQELQDAEDALDRLARERVLLGMEDREYLTQRDALRQRRDEARAALDRATSAAVTFDLPRTEQELRSTWEASDVDSRRRIVGAVLDRIVVRPVRVNGPRMFDPGRVDVCWRF